MIQLNLFGVVNSNFHHAVTCVRLLISSEPHVRFLTAKALMKNVIFYCVGDGRPPCSAGPMYVAWVAGKGTRPVRFTMVVQHWACV